MGIVAGWGRLSEGGQLPSILQYVSIFRLRQLCNLNIAFFLSFCHLLSTFKYIVHIPRRPQKYERQIKLGDFFFKFVALSENMKFT